MDENEIDNEAYLVEVAALTIIAERIRTIHDGASLRDALANSAKDMRRIDEAVNKGAESLAKSAHASVLSVGKKTDKWSEPFIEASGAAKSEAAATIAAKGADEAAESVKAVCNTKVMGLAKSKGKGFVPLREAYIAVVSDVANKMAVGKITGEKAIAEAVKSLSDGGLRVVSYDNGAESIRELHSAVRMNVYDTFSRTMNDARWAVGREFGADGVEISAHGLCAEDHLKYQGKQYSMAKFDEIQSNLERPIGEGYGCRHIAFPIILGVSDPALSERDRAELERLSTGEVTIPGARGDRKMTRYEASQIQRQMETRIRKARTNAHLMEAAGLDASAEKANVRQLLKKYREVSGQAGLETQLSRTRVHFAR